MERPRVLDHLHWFGHDSFRLDRPVVLYLDPWRLPAGSAPADVILVSHDHHDHCSPQDIQQIRQAKTVVIASPSAAPKIAPPVAILRPGESTKASGVTIEAVPAYNIGKLFHPRQAEGVGFILTIGDERLYFAGDTDHIPEMTRIRCDVALLPVSGVYTMTAEEAVQAAGDLKPRVAVPMHYGAGVAGSLEDAQHFQRLSPVPVLILESEA